MLLRGILGSMGDDVSLDQLGQALRSCGLCSCTAVSLLSVGGAEVGWGNSKRRACSAGEGNLGIDRAGDGARSSGAEQAEGRRVSHLASPSSFVH